MPKEQVSDAKKKLKQERNKKNDLAMQQVLTLLYKYFFVVTILVVIGVFYASYAFILRPKYDSIYSGEELTAKQTEYLDKLGYFKDIINLKTIYASITDEDKAKVDKILSSNNSKEDLFREMESITDKQKIKNIRSKEEFFGNDVSYADKSFIDTMEVALLPKSELRNLAESKQRGALFKDVEVIKTTFDLKDITYDDLSKILKIIEVNLRIMDVDSIKYDPAAKTAHLELLTYQVKK
jgi:hypothetical protein